MKRSSHNYGRPFDAQMFHVLEQVSAEMPMLSKPVLDQNEKQDLRTIAELLERLRELGLSED
jgi:hypothetical protein